MNRFPPAVVVRVDVDEARRHPQAGGVDSLLRGAGDAVPHFDDAAAPHGDVGDDRLRARAVDDEATLDEQIEHVFFSSCE
jgi:hypothetical protein